MAQSRADQQRRKVCAAMMARRSVAVPRLATVGAVLILVAILGGCPSRESPNAGDQPGAPGSAKGDYPSREEIDRNWPRFRGPRGLGISAYTNVPSSWNGSTGEGILWKTPVPLPGQNSPIVSETRVFLTGASEDEREVYCFDADSGKLLWQAAAADVPGSPSERPEVDEETGFAAPTAVTDGKRVYAIFANGDLACFDFDGERLWAMGLGNPDNLYGHASSLAVYQNLLLVLLDQGTAEDGLSQLIALEAPTGRTAWRTKRPVPNSWASPIVIDTGTREEIITCGAPWVIGYDPVGGEELWKAECLGGDVAPSPVYADGLVLATTAYELLAAIRPGGQGDVTQSHIAWTADYNLPDICSPVSSGNLVFLLTTEGILTCYDTKDGKMMWERDFDSTFRSSPTLVGDRVYLMNEEGVMLIVAASRDYEELGTAQLGEDSDCSPAFLDGRIYIRGTQNLYCIARATTEAK